MIFKHHHLQTKLFLRNFSSTFLDIVPDFLENNRLWAEFCTIFWRFLIWYFGPCANDFQTPSLANKTIFANFFPAHFWKKGKSVYQLNFAHFLGDFQFDIFVHVLMILKRPHLQTKLSRNFSQQIFADCSRFFGKKRLWAELCTLFWWFWTWYFGPCANDFETPSPPNKTLAKFFPADFCRLFQIFGKKTFMSRILHTFLVIFNLIFWSVCYWFSNTITCKPNARDFFPNTFLEIVPDFLENNRLWAEFCTIFWWFLIWYFGPCANDFQTRSPANKMFLRKFSSIFLDIVPDVWEKKTFMSWILYTFLVIFNLIFWSMC